MTNCNAVSEVPCLIITLASLVPIEMARRVKFGRNRREQVRRYGRGEAAGLIQKERAMPSGNPPYLVQRLLQRPTRLAAVKRGLHSLNP